jgi:hypothetical protein
MSANHSHFSATKIHSSGLVADKALLRHLAAALRQRLSLVGSTTLASKELTLTALASTGKASAPFGVLGKQLTQNQIRRKWFGELYDSAHYVCDTDQRD